MTIYCVYEKATGRFAGSGTPYIDDETYGSTTTPIPTEDSEPKPEWWYDPQTETWTYEVRE